MSLLDFYSKESDTKKSKKRPHFDTIEDENIKSNKEDNDDTIGAQPPSIKRTKLNNYNDDEDNLFSTNDENTNSNNNSNNGNNIDNNNDNDNDNNDNTNNNDNNKIVENINKEIIKEIDATSTIQTQKTEEITIEQIIADEKPIEQIIADEKPIEQIIADEKPIEQRVEGTTVEQSIVEGTTVEEKTVEKPIEQKTVEKKIVEQKIVEQKTVEEKVEQKVEQKIEKKIEPKTKNIPTKVPYYNCHSLLHSSWQPYLNGEFKKPYYLGLCNNLKAEESKGITIFPRVENVFRAFELCPWEKLKVVLIGQDPYHDDRQAVGLCFSVPRAEKIPSSLRNMYKEACDDVKISMPKHGNLEEWATQGILLLNTALTVRAHEANSHQHFGWLEFTDSVIRAISKEHNGIVFILWGKQAQMKEKMINLSKHRVIKSAHPSGLSASKGFYGSKPYSKTNKFLKELGKTAINWQIH